MLNGEVLPLHRVPLAVKVPLATTARCSGTASAATPLTENGAPQGDLQTTFPNRRLENSATGTRTRVARVRAEYPNQLDYSGFCNALDKRVIFFTPAFNDPRGASARHAHLLLGCNAIELAWRRGHLWGSKARTLARDSLALAWAGKRNTHRGARTHDHKVKGLALCRLS